MDAETVRWGLTLVAGVLMWLVKRTVDNMETRVETLEKEKNNYLHKDDFKEFKIELRAMVEEIKRDIRALTNHAD